MTKDVSCCTPGTNAAAAAEIMWNKNCGSLPVMEDGHGVVGMVTDRDLLIALGTRNRSAAELPVGEVMTGNLALCSPTDDLREAMKTMAERQLHRLPVVDKTGELRGILSLDDIALHAEGNGLAKDLIRTMKAVCNRQNQRVATVA